ncbi:MAG: hypothetical protein LBQ70_05625, partial [Prevotellaceae bacterium]|nr:hypothetical protein [Prevotellaceae bacterium]
MEDNKAGKRNPLPKELLKAIKDDNLVIFVGAGLSYDFVNLKGTKIEGWENMVRQILLHFETEKYDVTHLMPLIG